MLLNYDNHTYFLLWFCVEAILGYNFTDVNTIYSQLNSLNSIPPSKLPQVVSNKYILTNSVIVS